jgi:hypothetical protein
MHLYGLYALVICHSFDSMHFLYVVKVLHILLLQIISYIKLYAGIIKTAKK